MIFSILQGNLGHVILSHTALSLEIIAIDFTFSWSRSEIHLIKLLKKPSESYDHKWELFCILSSLLV